MSPGLDRENLSETAGHTGWAFECSGRPGSGTEVSVGCRGKQWSTNHEELQARERPASVWVSPDFCILGLQKVAMEILLFSGGNHHQDQHSPGE